ncbi:hypothetical protein V5O48_014452 [Marasmius crinis-equi]|uniref:Uncharacterized protein n=1 Tax=Marasmius crinis-equi TaxID=585013 RepID=A0ABR3EX88_9AGAR
MSALPAHSNRHYSYTIAVVLESGLIMPIFHTIFTGFMLDGSVKWTVALNIMAAMLPQIAALAPLLIVVRIGLGQATEENTSCMLGMFDGHPTSSSNGEPYGHNFSATTTPNKDFVDYEVVTIGYTGACGHNLHEKFEAKP